MSNGIPSVNDMFNMALMGNAGKSDLTGLDPEIVSGMRLMFFSGAAAVLHINDQIADIPDEREDEAVAELGRVHKEVHDFAISTMKAHS